MARVSPRDRFLHDAYLLRAICIPLTLILYIAASANIAHAGGIHIDERSLSFDNERGKDIFEANKVITMNFLYEWFAYAGKPNAYVVFEVYKGETKGDTSHRTPLNYFITRMDREQGIGQAKFHLPEADNTYTVTYHLVPFFSNKQLPVAEYGGYVPQELFHEIQQYYKSNPPITERLAVLKTSNSGPISSSAAVAIYWRNRLQQIDEAVNARRPPTFEWFIGSESSPLAEEIKFAYRLDPLEDWSEYSSSTKATYYLLTPGNYTFQVKAKYTVRGIEKESAIATYPIKVKEVIAAPPPKAALVQSKSLPSEFFQESHYSNSKALLIGITKYDDRAFPPLPFVVKDIKLLETVLLEYKFSIEKLVGENTRDGIKKKMNDFIASSQKGDRAILYFSGHGTSYGAMNYLAPSDCDTKRKVDTCLSYDDLKSWIDRLMTEKEVRHLLVVLDACQAGLGLYSKSSNVTPIEQLAKYPGAHMMTAGLMDQEAQIDIQEGVSVFTQKLVNGLQGAADLIPDKVITLSELLVYVQDQVSTQVMERYGKEQIPVMGKVKGAGEMLFLLK